MKRPAVVVGVAIAGVLGLRSLMAADAQAQGTRRPPNFIIILADDQGYGDLGSYGHPTIRTPHVDRLATQGMTFTRASEPWA